MAYNRALRTTVATDKGPLAVYVAHLGSVRVNPEARPLSPKTTRAF